MRRLMASPRSLLAAGGVAALSVVGEGVLRASGFHPWLDLTPAATLVAGLMIAARTAPEEAAPPTVAPLPLAPPPPRTNAPKADADNVRSLADKLAAKLIEDRCHVCLAPSVAKRGAQELDAVGVYADFAGRQIESVLATAEEAVGVIGANVADADMRISKLLGVLRGSGTQDEVAKAVQEIERQIAACRDLIARFSEEQREASAQSDAQRARVLKETGDVLRSLDRVDHIARTTTMMAINVSIEAARAGAAGNGFMVIAKEIRELAASTQALASDVGARMGGLQRAVNHDLGEDARRRDDVANKAFAEVSDTLSSLLRNVLAIVKHEREALSEIEHEEEAISSAIVSALARMQFHDIVRQQLEQLAGANGMVREHLSEVAGALAELRDPGAAGLLIDKLEAEQNNYRMDHQRVSHGAAMRRSVEASAAPKIEMF